MEELYQHGISVVIGVGASYVTSMIRLATLGKSVADAERRLTLLEAKHDQTQDRLGRIEESTTRLETKMDFLISQKHT